MNVRTAAILMTVLAAVLWSTGGVFIKLLPQDPMVILFYRSLYTSILFILYFGYKNLRFNRLSMVSSLFYAPLLITFVTATKLTTAANAIFLQYTAPAIVLLIEPWLVRTKLLKINIVTVLICFLGMLLFFMDQMSTPDNWLGIWLALASGFILAGLLVTQKMNKSEYHSGAIMTGNLLVCLIALPWAVEAPVPMGIDQVYLLILGFGQLGLGYILFLFGQKHLPAIESALIAMLEPLLNPVWVFMGHGEHPGNWAIAGGSIIVAALIFRLYYLDRRSLPSVSQESENLAKHN